MPDDDDKGAAEKAADKAMERVCIERWQWTIAKLVAAFAFISAIAHIGEAVSEIISLWP